MLESPDVAVGYGHLAGGVVVGGLVIRLLLVKGLDVGDGVDFVDHNTLVVLSMIIWRRMVESIALNIIRVVLRHASLRLLLLLIWRNTRRRPSSANDVILLTLVIILRQL